MGRGPRVISSRPTGYQHVVGGSVGFGPGAAFLDFVLGHAEGFEEFLVALGLHFFEHGMPAFFLRIAEAGGIHDFDPALFINHIVLQKRDKGMRTVPASGPSFGSVRFDSELFEEFEDVLFLALKLGGLLGEGMETLAEDGFGFAVAGRLIEEAGNFLEGDAHFAVEADLSEAVDVAVGIPAVVALGTCGGAQESEAMVVEEGGAADAAGSGDLSDGEARGHSGSFRSTDRGNVHYEPLDRSRSWR
jgi:hypothetical protein